MPYQRTKNGARKVSGAYDDHSRLVCLGELDELGLDHFHCLVYAELDLVGVAIMYASDQYQASRGTNIRMEYAQFTRKLLVMGFNILGSGTLEGNSLRGPGTVMP